MKAGDLVFHKFWGRGMIVHQQGVVDRWCIRLFQKPPSIFKPKLEHLRYVWGSELEVISESR